jgi:hypothetical protein
LVTTMVMGKSVAYMIFEENAWYLYTSKCLFVYCPKMSREIKES